MKKRRYHSDGTVSKIQYQNRRKKQNRYMVVHFLCFVQTFQENVDGLTDFMELNLPSFGV